MARIVHCVRQQSVVLLRPLCGVTLAFTFALSPGTVCSQETKAPTPPLPEVTAIRTTSTIKIDGLLTEPDSDFTQRDPSEGAPATFKTEAWTAYDDEALYVAARLYDNTPDSIVGRLARPDEDFDSDLFRVCFDPYHDHLRHQPGRLHSACGFVQRQLE